MTYSKLGAWDKAARIATARLAVSSDEPEAIIGAAVHEATVAVLRGASRVERWTRYVRQVRASDSPAINRRWGELPPQVWNVADTITELARLELAA